MGHFVSLNTAEKFLNLHGSSILEAYAEKGLLGSLQLKDEVLIFVPEKPEYPTIIVGYSDEECFWVLDKFNLPEELAEELSGDLDEEDSLPLQEDCFEH